MNSENDSPEVIREYERLLLLFKEPIDQNQIDFLFVFIEVSYEGEMNQLK